MCGICGIVALDGRGRRPGVLGAMSATLRAPRPRQRRRARSTGRSGSPPGGWRSSTSRAATSRSPARTAASSSSRTARSTTTRELRAELERGRPPVPHAALATPRCSSTSTRSTGRASSSACAGCSPSRCGTRDRAAARARARPLRDQAAVLPRRPAASFAFASELKALRRLPGFSRDDRPRRARGVPRLQRRSRRRCTIFRAVRKLPPGHAARAASGGRPRSSATPDRARARGDARRGTSRRGAGGRAARAAARLRARAPRRRRARSACCSRAASTPRRWRRWRRTRVRAPRRDVLDRLRGALVRRARAGPPVAERYGTDHHELVVEPDAAELLPEIVGRLRRAVRATPRRCRRTSSPQLAAQHVKVALSGEGGDELFGGYETYVADQLALAVGPRRAAAARRWSSGCRARSRRVPLDYRAKRFARAAHLPPLERHHGWKEIFSPDARAELLRAERRGTEDPLDVYRARWAETEGAEPLARLQDVDRAHLPRRRPAGQDRPHEHGPLARARVPFLDPVVAELALALPTAARCAGAPRSGCCARRSSRSSPARSRAGARRASRSPPRPGCAGELEPFCREVLGAERLRGQGYFDPAAVTRLIDEHVARREDHSRQLWGLMSFSLWQDGLAADAASAPAALSGLT